MKKLAILFASASLLAACTKPSNTTTTNNYTTQLPTPIPAFTVNGINDISLDHSSFGSNYSITMPLIIQYQDSTQQKVTVSVSGIPTTNSGTQDGVLATGVPTFSCSIQFVSLSFSGDTPIPVGTYPITVTCTGTMSGTKTFTFNLTVY